MTHSHTPDPSPKVFINGLEQISQLIQVTTGGPDPVPPPYLGQCVHNCDFESTDEKGQRLRKFRKKEDKNEDVGGEGGAGGGV